MSGAWERLWGGGAVHAFAVADRFAAEHPATIDSIRQTIESAIREGVSFGQVESRLFQQEREPSAQR